MAETNFFCEPLSENILQERDQSGAVTAEYTTETGQYGNNISQNRCGTESQFHYDALGSTLAVTGASQNLTDVFSYTAFGMVADRTGPTNAPLQYIGQQGYYVDPLTQQDMCRRRVYSALESRWLSRDPLGIQYGPRDDYVYASNRPVLLTDPSGFVAAYPFPLGSNISTVRCGQTYVQKWSFHLDNDSPCLGYFVQHIRYFTCHRSCKNCCDDAACDVYVESDQFWEAWLAGASNARRGPNILGGTYGSVDQFSGEIPNNTCGYDIVDATLRFYCLKTDDKKRPATLCLEGKLDGPVDALCEFYKAERNKTWGPRHPHSRFATSSINEPDFWKLKPIEGDNIRRFTIYWECCERRLVAGGTDAPPKPTK